jgi:hypothetical protein
MKIAVIDGVNQDIGLNILFPEADYYIQKTEYDKKESLNYYNILPDKDWSKITDKNYDCLFIVIALYDAKVGTNFFKNDIYLILNQIIEIVNNNNFKNVCLFDNYDYDYDPNTIINNSKIKYFFKRNYNKLKMYEKNVIPFPFIMFGEKSLIEKCDKELVSRDAYFQEKQNRVFFTGSLFNHIDNEIEYYRDRRKIYTEIQHIIYNPGNLCYNDFLFQMRNSKFSLDLLGVGDPNKRTFEILVSGSLMISEYNNLRWPFEECFAEETIFKDSNDFFEKIDRLSTDDELYNKCLMIQYNIVEKYFNKKWVKDYILQVINGE